MRICVLPSWTNSLIVRYIHSVLYLYRIGIIFLFLLPINALILSQMSIIIFLFLLPINALILSPMSIIIFLFLLPINALVLSPMSIIYIRYQQLLLNFLKFNSFIWNIICLYGICTVVKFFDSTFQFIFQAL